MSNYESWRTLDGEKGSGLSWYRRAYFNYLNVEFKRDRADLVPLLEPEFILADGVSLYENHLFSGMPVEPLYDAISAGVIATRMLSGDIVEDILAHLPAHQVSGNIITEHIFVGTVIEYLEKMIKERKERNQVPPVKVVVGDNDEPVNIGLTNLDFPLYQGRDEDIKGLVASFKELPDYNPSFHVAVEHVDLKTMFVGVLKSAARWRYLEKFTSQTSALTNFLLRYADLRLDIYNNRQLIKTTSLEQSTYFIHVFNKLIDVIRTPPSVLLALSEPFKFPYTQKMFEAIIKRMSAYTYPKNEGEGYVDGVMAE